MYFIGDTMPVVLTYRAKGQDCFSILSLMATAAHVSTMDERQTLVSVLGIDAASEAMFDTVCQDHPRAMFLSRLRHAIDERIAAEKQIAILHSMVLSAARMAVVTVSHTDTHDDDSLPNTPGYYALSNVRSMRGATRHKTRSAAMSVARSRMADYADRFFPLRNAI